MKRFFLTTSTALALFLSCKKEEKKEKVTKEKEAKEIKREAVNYVYDNGSVRLNVSVKKTPEKAAVFSQFMTEMLLGMGLGDKIILGTSEGEILPRLQKEYDKIPTKILGHHYPVNREAFLLLGADFVSGWDGAVKPETTGSAEELIKNNIYPYTVKSTKSNATLETVYEDFYMLGRIFNAEEQTASLVKNLQEKLKKATVNFKDAPTKEKRIRVIILGPRDNGAYVVGSLATDLIARANGVNTFKELDNDYELVSYESIVKIGRAHV